MKSRFIWTGPPLLLLVLTVTAVSARHLICNPRHCSNKGNCSMFSGGAKCSCTSHYTGDRCELDVDECKSPSPPCHNGGKCTNYHGGFNCRCPDGWAGPDCAINKDDCKLSEDPQCLNGGTCVDRVGYYECLCPPDKTGPRCQYEKCKLITCAKSATCILDKFGNGTCLCWKGWTGKFCDVDINECEDVYSPDGLCSNRGSCRNTIGSWACDCVLGFAGQYCETNATCQLNPCINGGTCTASADGFKCTCPKGYTGKTCERDIDDCASSPCQHNGTCVDGINAHTCHCGNGYTGQDCNTEIDECASNPCLNGTTCHDRVNGFDCLDQGDLSTTTPLEGNGTNDPLQSRIILVVVVSALGLGATCVVIKWWCCPSRLRNGGLNDEGLEDYTSNLGEFDGERAIGDNSSVESCESHKMVSVDADRLTARWTVNRYENQSRLAVPNTNDETPLLKHRDDANVQDSFERAALHQSVSIEEENQGTPLVGAVSSPVVKPRTSVTNKSPGVSKRSAVWPGGARPKTTRVETNPGKKCKQEAPQDLCAADAEGDPLNCVTTPVLLANDSSNSRRYDQRGIDEARMARPSSAGTAETEETFQSAHSSGDDRTPSPSNSIPIKQPFVQTDKPHVLFLGKTWHQFIINEMAVQFARSEEVRVSCLVARTDSNEQAEAEISGVKLYSSYVPIGISNDDQTLRPPDSLIDDRVDIIISYGHFGGVQAQTVKRHFRKSNWVHIAASSPDDNTNCELQFCELSDVTFAIGTKLSEDYDRLLTYSRKTVDGFVPGIIKKCQQYEQSEQERKILNVLVFYPLVEELKSGIETGRIPARAIAQLSQGQFHLIAVRAPQDESNNLEIYLLDDLSLNQFEVRGYPSIEERCKLYVEAYVLLLPFVLSKTDAFGMMGLEAFSAGLPILLSQDQGLANALEQVLFGPSYKIKSDQPEAWAASMENMKDRPRCFRLSELKAVRENYGKQFSWETQCNKVLQKILKSMRPK